MLLKVSQLKVCEMNETISWVTSKATFKFKDEYKELLWVLGVHDAWLSGLGLWMDYLFLKIKILNHEAWVASALFRGFKSDFRISHSVVIIQLHLPNSLQDPFQTGNKWARRNSNKGPSYQHYHIFSPVWTLDFISGFRVLRVQSVCHRKNVIPVILLFLHRSPRMYVYLKVL